MFAIWKVTKTIIIIVELTSQPFRCAAKLQNLTVSLYICKYYKYRGGNPNDHVFTSTLCSVYNEHTWWCNMSYERKFCQLSEYVRVQKVGSLIKSTHVFKWNSADFDKFGNSQKLVNFRPFSLIWKLPWPSLRPQYNISCLKGVLRLEADI